MKTITELIEAERCDFDALKAAILRQLPGCSLEAWKECWAGVTHLAQFGPGDPDKKLAGDIQDWEFNSVRWAAAERLENIFDERGI